MPETIIMFLLAMLSAACLLFSLAWCWGMV
jgi:hypothetical protein